MEIGDEKYIFRSAVVRAPTPDGGPRADSEVRERKVVLRLRYPITITARTLYDNRTIRGIPAPRACNKPSRRL